MTNNKPITPVVPAPGAETNDVNKDTPNLNGTTNDHNEKHEENDVSLLTDNPLWYSSVNNKWKLDPQ